MKRLTALVILLIMGAASLHAQYDKDVISFRGRNFLSDGKYAQAIEQFNVLARLDTADYWTFFYRGIAKYNLGDLRGASKDFDTSVRLNPVFTNGYHYRAITKSRTGHYDEALSDLEHAIKLRPGNTGLYYSRGVTYFLAQRFDEAIRDFDKFIRLEPRDPGAYLNRGASYLYLGDTTKAINDYNKAIKFDRYDPEGYLRRGRVYASQGKTLEAISDMDHAIVLDSTNTLAYFYRALMYYDQHDYNAAMADLNRVLRDEPGNALTLYNRSLIYAQVGDYEDAIADIDRVININPGNVLAYFNRASFFIEQGKYNDALDDYSKAIELYPDFAKAYMNRSYVENQLGMTKASKNDYQTAQQKVAEYRLKNASAEGSFADTTRKYSSLLAFDADFARKDFDDELLQHRDIDIHLKPLYKFALTSSADHRTYALSSQFENSLLNHFLNSAALPVVISNTDVPAIKVNGRLENALYGDSHTSAGARDIPESEIAFLKGMYEVQNKHFNTALNYFDEAVSKAEDDASRDKYIRYYRSFYLMNRGALRAEMIDFIASIQNNVQTLTMDDKGTTRARVSDQVSSNYDYSEAISDMEQAGQITPDIPYIFYDLGNLYCLDSQLVNSIANYDKAITLYPYMGEAYFNRGLVLIYLKDKEKGCIDLSRAGELGVPDAYSVISKYCETQEGL